MTDRGRSLFREVCTRRIHPLLCAGLILGVAACTSPYRQGAPADDPALTEELRAALEPKAIPDVRDVDLEAPSRTHTPVARRVWVELEGRDTRTVAVPWIEMKGVAGASSGRSYDVVIVLDVSGSTRYASGADINANGTVGVRGPRIRPWQSFDPQSYNSDPGDSVLDAERIATYRLIERLDPQYTRVALVAFSDLARMRAPLGSSRDLLGRVLEDLAGGFGAGPTNLANATRVASRILQEAEAPGVDAAKKRILLLSDGEPTHPAPAENAAAEALLAAKEAGEAGIRITTFALGAGLPEEQGVFGEMAKITGGTPLRLEEPGDLLHVLPQIDLASVARVEITNLTSGTPARAQRTRPDGRFDAFLKLVPGANQLRVVAHGLDGGQAVRLQTVYFDPSKGDPKSLENVQRALQQRTLELQLEQEVRSARQRKRLELEGAGEL